MAAGRERLGDRRAHHGRDTDHQGGGAELIERIAGARANVMVGVASGVQQRFDRRGVTQLPERRWRSHRARRGRDAEGPR